MKTIFFFLFLLISTNAFAATASWYDSESVKREGTCHEEKCYTASGREIHELEAQGIDFCAASKDYKMGSLLKVTNRSNGRSVVVKVYDRGGFGKYGRSVDLSRHSFGKIASTKKGVVEVSIIRI